MFNNYYSEENQSTLSEIKAPNCMILCPWGGTIKATPIVPLVCITDLGNLH